MEANSNEALREAVSELLSEIGKYTLDGLEVIWIGLKGNTICRLKSALAHPRRNCDVGTAEEQSARWWKFCEKHFILSPAKDNCAKCPIRGTNRHCELAWAQMPYDENEGDAK